MYVGIFTLQYSNFWYFCIMCITYMMKNYLKRNAEGACKVNKKILPKIVKVPAFLLNFRC